MYNKPSINQSGDFEPGVKVRILEGPFREFRGIVTKIDPTTQMVEIAVNFFGKEVQAELDRSKIVREP